MCSIMNTVNEMEEDYRYINKITIYPKQEEVSKWCYIHSGQFQSCWDKDVPERPDSCLHSQNQMLLLANLMT